MTFAADMYGINRQCISNYSAINYCIFLHSRHGFNLSLTSQINREIKHNEEGDRKRIHLHTN